MTLTTSTWAFVNLLFLVFGNWLALLIDLLRLFGGLLLDETRFLEKLSETLFVDRLAKEVVHAWHFGTLFVLFARVGRDAAYERLSFLSHPLVHILRDLHASLDAATLRHTVIQQDQLVCVTLCSIPLLDPVYCLVTIRRSVTLNPELHEHTLQRDCIKCVIINDKHGSFWLPMVLLICQHHLDRTYLDIWLLAKLIFSLLLYHLFALLLQLLVLIVLLIFHLSGSILLWIATMVSLNFALFSLVLIFLDWWEVQIIDPIVWHFYMRLEGSLLWCINQRWLLLD